MGYGRKMEISVGFKELGILAKKYVQNSKKYRANVLSLKILQLPEVQKELRQNPDIHTDK